MTLERTSHQAMAPVTQGAGASLPVFDSESGMTIIQLGEHFARSGFFKDVNDPSKAVVKMLIAKDLGITKPMVAMTQIYVFDGRCQISSNLLAALVKRSDNYDYRITEHSSDVCKIAFFEKGQQIGESVFTREQAQKAGLLGKDVWIKYTQNMLFARALSNGVKWYCPDIANGMALYTEADELPSGDEIDGDTGTITPSPAIVNAGQQTEKKQREADARYGKVEKPTPTPATEVKETLISRETVVAILTECDKVPGFMGINPDNGKKALSAEGISFLLTLGIEGKLNELTEAKGQGVLEAMKLKARNETVAPSDEPFKDQ